MITTAFMSLVCLDEVEAKAGDDASDAAWFYNHDEQAKRRGKASVSDRASKRAKWCDIAS